MWDVVYTKQALKDKEKLKAAKLDKKAKQLIDMIKENPFQTSPMYEQLVGNLAGVYSRRISLRHRLVYEVVEDETREHAGTIKIIRMWTHYE